MKSDLAQELEGLFVEEPLVEELQRCLVPADKAAGRDFACLQHPLVQQVPYAPLLARSCNLLLQHKRDALAEARKQEAWHSYVFLHERPWRPQALAEVLVRWPDLISAPAYHELLGDAWVDTEQEGSAYWPLLWNAKGGLSGRLWRMSDDEHRAFNALRRKQSTLIVYRGEWGKQKASARWSWTLDREVARFFAGRLKPKRAKARILRAEVSVDHVEAYFTRRKEAEVVVHPKRRIPFTVEAP